jgi:hypothetical protein
MLPWLRRGAGSAAPSPGKAPRPARSAPPSNLVRCQRCSVKKAIDGEDERAPPQSKKKKRTGGLEKAIRRPIRPQVVRSHGFAVPDDPEAVKRENALLEELHEKAVAAERRGKLKLLLQRYSLAEDDYEGLALALAIKHEPGFQVVDRQIVQLPIGFSEPVRVKDGELTDKTSGRPLEWSGERLLQLLEAVQREKKKSGLTKDLDALGRLARQEQWRPSANHRGEWDAWIRTLQSRLHDAKRPKRKIDALNAMITKIERQIGE